jgi:hypothetical protein
LTTINFCHAIDLTTLSFYLEILYSLISLSSTTPSHPALASSKDHSTLYFCKINFLIFHCRWDHTVFVLSVNQSGWFYIFTIVNDAAVDMGLYINFISFGYIPRYGITGSCGSIFNFLSNHHTAFHNDWTN